MKLPLPIQKFIADAKELPSIGPRQATRLAFYLIDLGRSGIQTLADDIANLGSIKICSRCFFVHQNLDELCDICKNPARNQAIIMIVEKETDLISLEQTGKFIGRYLVLGQIPKTEILENSQKLLLESLKTFIKNSLPGGNGLPSQLLEGKSSEGKAHSTSSPQAGSGQAEEIILALNPTSGGDTSAIMLKRELEPYAKKISRLGRGLPSGGEIEFADEDTLGSALDRRL